MKTVIINNNYILNFSFRINILFFRQQKIQPIKYRSSERFFEILINRHLKNILIKFRKVFRVNLSSLSFYYR